MPVANVCPCISGLDVKSSSLPPLQEEPHGKPRDRVIPVGHQQVHPGAYESEWKQRYNTIQKKKTNNNIVANFTGQQVAWGLPYKDEPTYYFDLSY